MDDEVAIFREISAHLQKTLEEERELKNTYSTREAAHKESMGRERALQNLEVEADALSTAMDPAAPNPRERSPRRSKWDASDDAAQSVPGGAVPKSAAAAPPAGPGAMTNSMFRDMLNDPSLYAPADPAAAYASASGMYAPVPGQMQPPQQQEQQQAQPIIPGYNYHQQQQAGYTPSVSSTYPGSAYGGGGGSSVGTGEPDSGINPLTNTPYSQRYWDIMEKRKTLPCAAAKKDFLKLVKKNQVTVLVGETGSGKTTQMPQFILDAGYATYGKSVACTQPRRVAAMSVAQRVADEMDVELGTYSCIILDEAHERTLATDVLFGLLKQIMPKRPDLKIVVMSATLDAEKMQTYFNSAPMINVPGRTFPVEIYYTPEPEKDYLQAAIRTVLMIHNEEPDGDILLFLTGEEEIEYACRTLMQSARSTELQSGELKAVALYSSLPPHLQQRIFEPAPRPRIAGGRAGRKVVVSTNIAETSVTIDGIVYVVDPGLSKQKVFNPRIRVESLLVTPISQASASQRSGRAGRTRPGKCFRLYTENSFKTLLPPQTYPEILRSNLSTIVLTLLKLGIEDLVHFDFLDPPAPETLMHALNHLRNLGALDDAMQMTPLGKLMSEFPLDSNHAKMLISAGQYGCTSEILSIVALLSVPVIFVRGKEKEAAEAKKCKEQFAHIDGDHLQLLEVYAHYCRQMNLTNGGSGLEFWCKKNYVNFRSLQSASSVRGQLKAILERLAIPLVSAENLKHDSSGIFGEKIRKAVLAGGFTNVARLQADGKNKDKYLNIQDNQSAEAHPSTCLQHKPEWVVFNDIVLTQKNYIRTVSKIKPEWCVEVADDYFAGKLMKLPGSMALRELEQVREKLMMFQQHGQGTAQAAFRAQQQEQFEMEKAAAEMQARHFQMSSGMGEGMANSGVNQPVLKNFHQMQVGG
eukprot:g19625.t1